MPKFELPKLPYDYNALEPYIDAKTMDLHHTKHHATYVSKLNEALAKHSELQDKSLNDLIGNLERMPDDIRVAIRNHGGGHWNHTMFWQIMRPANETKGANPTDVLLASIVKSFSGFDAFK